MTLRSVAGFSYYNCPSDGLGPFRKLFKEIPKRIVKFTDLELLDAVFLWGGSDISPTLYGETPIYNCGPKEPSNRDIYEWEIIKYAVKHKIPIIGICRGAQMLCAYAGGSLIQDVNGHNCGHHDIMTNEGITFNVTSAHHQMMYPYDIDHEMIAWSEHKYASYYKSNNPKACDKILKLKTKEPEIVYFPDINGFAIQGHPEWEKQNSPFLPWVLDKIVEKCFTKEKV